MTDTQYSRITDLGALREIVGFPRDVIANKATSFLTPLVRQYIEASPYFMLATAAEDGTCDVSPRGDPAGGAFAIVDERTLLLPERLGNRRIDSMQNILGNGHVGLLFLVPGVDETVRVNGRAFISDDPALRERLAQRGKLPQVVIVVEIEEVFTHCARSVLRSSVWNAETWPDADEIPTLNMMMAEQSGIEPEDESGGKRKEAYREVLY